MEDVTDAEGDVEGAVEGVGQSVVAMFEWL